MQHYNSRIDLRPSTIFHAASTSHCDTCWLAPWCENIRVPASFPCKKRAWITGLSRQWSSWINPPTHHTNLAMSIKLDFLIAGGDLHCAQHWLRYYRHSAVQTAEMMARSRENSWKPWVLCRFGTGLWHWPSLQHWKGLQAKSRAKNVLQRSLHLADLPWFAKEQ